MIYKTKELLVMGETEYSIRKKVANHSLFMISRGMYATSKDDIMSESEGCISKRYPNAIFTGISAFSYYGLTDHVPDYYYIVTPQHSFPIRRKDVKQSYQDSSTINIGVVEIQTPDGPYKIYDRERMLIELIRLKGRYSPELYYEVLRSFRKIKEELDQYKLTTYARRFKNGSLLMFKIKELL